MRKRLSADQLALWDPFRPLDWRWRLAAQLACGAIPRRRITDPAILSAAAFQKPPDKRSRGDRAKRVRQDQQAITAAVELSQLDGLPRWGVETWLLAGEEDAVIASRLGCCTEGVCWFEKLFFNVRGVGSDYLLIRTVGPGPWRGFRDHELRQFWAWLALGGGPLVAAAVIEAFEAAWRPGEAPALSVYLRPNSGVQQPMQTLVATSLLPSTAAPQFTQFQCRLFEIPAAGDALRATFLLERLRKDIIRTARAYSAGKPLPGSRRQASTKRAGSQPTSGLGLTGEALARMAMGPISLRSHFSRR